MHFGGSIQLSGELQLTKLRRGPGGSWSATPMRELTLREIFKYGRPQAGLDREINEWRRRNFPNLWRGLWRVALARLFRLPVHYGALSLVVTRADGRILDYGLASLRVVTNAGVNAIVDAFQNTFEVENFRYHGVGTNNTAEAAGDTALGAELTTQLNPNNVRATGSQAENGANVYRTVGTNLFDASVALVEHGIFSDPDVGEGTLLDRSVFSVVNLGSGETLQSTYDLTLASGG